MVKCHIPLIRRDVLAWNVVLLGVVAENRLHAVVRQWAQECRIGAVAGVDDLDVGAAERGRRLAWPMR